MVKHAHGHEPVGLVAGLVASEALQRPRAHLAVQPQPLQVRQRLVCDRPEAVGMVGRRQLGLVGGRGDLLGLSRGPDHGFSGQGHDHLRLGAAPMLTEEIAGELHRGSTGFRT